MSVIKDRLELIETLGNNGLEPDNFVMLTCYLIALDALVNSIDLLRKEIHEHLAK